MKRDVIARSLPGRKNLSMMFFEGRIASTASLKFLEWNNVPRKFAFSLFVEIGEVLKSKIGVRVGSSSLHVRKNLSGKSVMFLKRLLMKVDICLIAITVKPVIPSIRWSVAEVTYLFLIFTVNSVARTSVQGEGPESLDPP